MKFMNTKRFASVAMAGAIALSLATPAFAASSQPKNSTVITGAYAETPIAVTVPTTGTAKINPFGLPVSMTKSDGETKVNIVGQQITHEVLSVRNNGDVALDMGVKSFLVVPKGEVSIDSSKDTDKQIKVDLQVAGLDDAKFAVMSTEETLPDRLMDAFADDATWTGATTVAAPAVAAGADGSSATPGSTADNSPAAVLGAATVSPDGEVTYGNSSIALFRLKGDMAKEPKTGTTENPWETADGFTATVVFKFVPATTRYAVTIGSVAGGTVTADVAQAAEGQTVTLTPTPTTPGQTPTYTVKKTGDAAATPEAVTGNTFTMPAYAVTVTATFS